MVTARLFFAGVPSAAFRRNFVTRGKREWAPETDVEAMVSSVDRENHDRPVTSGDVRGRELNYRFRTRPGTDSQTEVLSIEFWPTSGETPIGADDFAAFVVARYFDAIDAGCRPQQVWVTGSEGRYRRYKFTVETINRDLVLGLEWMHVLTPSQVATLGRERLHAAPAYRVEELKDGSMLLVTMESADDQSGIEAVEAHLGLSGPVGTHWSDDLTHEVEKVRERACWHLQKDSVTLSTEDVQRFEDVFWELTDDHRYRVLAAIEDAPAEARLPLLTEIVDRERTQRVWRAAVSQFRTLDRSGYELDGVDTQAVWDPDAPTGVADLTYIEEFPAERFRERVIDYLETGSTPERRKSGELVWKHTLEAAYDALLDRADDPDPIVRKHVVELLRRAELVDTHVEILSTLLEDEDPDVRLASARLHPDPERAIPALRSLVHETGETGDIGVLAIEELVLRRQHAPETVDRCLRDGLTADSPRTRFEAAMYLDSETAIETLVDLLTTDYTTVREQVPEKLARKATAPRNADELTGATIRALFEAVDTHEDPGNAVDTLASILTALPRAETERHLDSIARSRLDRTLTLVSKRETDNGLESLLSAAVDRR